MFKSHQKKRKPLLFSQALLSLIDTSWETSSKISIKKSTNSSTWFNKKPDKTFRKLAFFTSLINWIQHLSTLTSMGWTISWSSFKQGKIFSERFPQQKSSQNIENPRTPWHLSFRIMFQAKFHGLTTYAKKKPQNHWLTMNTS